MSTDPAFTFADLGLRPQLLEALTTLGYEEPTPIQREAIGPLLEGRDLLGQAATGTGKTAAFALPLLNQLPEGDRGIAPSALVLVPTRELAVQVSEAVHRYGRGIGARVLPIYGGQPFTRQLRALERGVDVVVATPGRALDHIGRGSLNVAALRTVVLDEADEMLDMGFTDDIESILSGTPSERQTVLFSATMPARIEAIARRHQRDPLRIQLERATTPGEAPLVRQAAYIVGRAHKAAALGRVLDIEQPDAAIVFCRTRDVVDTLTETLNGRGYRAEALHGGMSQEQRDRVMGRLRSGATDLLVATDVAARGLDVEQLTHVVNYDLPSAAEAYVHRVGRVGRAGREGVAITLAEPREHRMLKNIERVSGRKMDIEKLPTVADLRARRLELTRSALEERLQAGELEGMRVVVDALGDEYDIVEIALAATALAHEALVGGDESEEQEIPQPSARPQRDDRQGGGGKRRPDGQGGGGGRPQHSPGMTRIFIGAGHTAGLKPRDLVGAITGETPLTGREIGAISMSDRFSLVEVPDAQVDAVIEGLRKTHLKGRHPTIRREKF